MDTKNARAMACHCPKGHLPGCELLLWLIVKYGDPQQRIKGIAELSNATNVLSDSAVEACDRWVAKLHDLWVSEKRLTLTPDECGWRAEYASPRACDAVLGNMS